MKYRAIHFLAAGLATMLAGWGCSTEDGVATMHEGVAAFTGEIAGIGTGTRVSGTSWESGDEIGVFMLTGGGAIPGGVITAGGVQAYNTQYQWEGSMFAPSGSQILYLNDGMPVDFVAYHPYLPDGSLNNHRYPVDFSDQPQWKDNDLLVARAPGVTPGTETVPLVFDHMVSRLELKIEKGAGMEAVDLSSLTMKFFNMASRGYYSFSDSGFEVVILDDVVPLTLTAGSDYMFYLIPEPGRTGRYIEFYLGSEKFVWNLPDDLEFLSGRRHPWTITINRTGIDARGGFIIDWSGIQDPATMGETAAVKYKVGDFWPDPNVILRDGVVVSGKAPVAMVLEITDGVGYHGKVVDLYDQQRYLYIDGVQYDIRWGDPTVDELASGVTAIRDNDYGRVQTRQLISMRKDQPDFASNYCLFNWIYSERNKGDLDGMWYIPTIPEAWKVGDNISIYNERRNEIGLENFRSNNFLWTSVEATEEMAIGTQIVSRTVFSRPKNQATWSNHALAFGDF